MPQFLVGQSDCVAFVRRHTPFVFFGGAFEAVDIAAVGTLVASRGQLESAAAALQFDDILNAAFAPGAFTDHDRAAMVLQARGHDFAGAGTKAIDQNRHRKAFVSAFLFREDNLLGDVAAGGADNPSLGDKHVANLDRRREQAARIETQIDDQPAQPLVDQRLDRLAHLVGRVPAERGNPDVANLALFVEEKIP